MVIDWTQIGDQEFNVFDNNFGFWAENGFTANQANAKVYCQSSLTESERDAIENGNCMLLSA